MTPNRTNFPSLHRCVGKGCSRCEMGNKSYYLVACAHSAPLLDEYNSLSLHPFNKFCGTAFTQMDITVAMVNIIHHPVITHAQAIVNRTLNWSFFRTTVANTVTLNVNHDTSPMKINPQPLSHNTQHLSIQKFYPGKRFPLFLDQSRLEHTSSLKQDVV